MLTAEVSARASSNIYTLNLIRGAKLEGTKLFNNCGFVITHICRSLSKGMLTQYVAGRDLLLTAEHALRGSLVQALRDGVIAVTSQAKTSPKGYQTPSTGCRRLGCSS